MFRNPVRELRERLGLTQEQFATEADLSKKMVEQYEQGATGEKAARLAVIAGRAGYRDLEIEFRRAAGEEVKPQPSSIDLERLEPYEQDLASMMVSIYRNRTNHVRRGIVELVENEIMRESEQAKAKSRPK